MQAFVVSTLQLHNCMLYRNNIVNASNSHACLHKNVEVLMNKIDVFSVFSKRCPSCLSTRAYDGSNHGILNMGKFAVGYDVLKDYLYHFVLGNR